MMYQLFFFASIIMIVLSLIFFKKKVEALVIGFIGLFAGILVEINGVRQGHWSYELVPSLWKPWNVPIEILMGYFVGAFVITIYIFWLYDISDEKERKQYMVHLIPIMTLPFLIYTIFHNGHNIIIPMAFLGIWGLFISKRQSIPVIVGFTAFVADMVVENILIWSEAYYYWDFAIGLSFMFAGMAIAGIVTSWECKSSKAFCFYEPK